jgi:hypothetical protein
MPAAPAVAEPVPQWSGLDARAYAGSIPAAGSLITSVPLDPVLSVTGAANAFRILYATVDQHDRPAVSTAAVFVPRGAAPAGGWPVIAWAHGTVGLGDDCTPSALPRRPTPPAAISYASYILAALREARPDLGIDQVLTPRGRELADMAQYLCKPALDHQAAGAAVNDLFSAPIDTLPGIASALEAFMGTPVDGYDRPIFLGQGMLDTDVPPLSTQTLYQQLLDHHQDVELHLYPDQDHSGTAIASMSDSIRFLHRVMTEESP